MLISKKVGIVTSALLLTGALAAGAAFAAESTTPEPSAPPAQTDTAAPTVKPEPSVGEQEVMGQLSDLRQAAAEKLQADAKALIDQAVADGKITQVQADRLLSRGGKFGGHGKGFGEIRGKHGRGGFGFGGHRGVESAEELQSRLDSAVEAGKLTQEQADQLLQKWTEHQAQQAEAE